MPILKSKVHNMEREYLIVYDDNIRQVGQINGGECCVIALSPSLVRHGAYCAQKYDLDIQDAPSYQQQQQQLIELLDSLRQSNTQLQSWELELAELTRQRDTLEKSVNMLRSDITTVRDNLTNANQARYDLSEMIDGYRNQLVDADMNLLETTRQRDGFSRSLRRTINHLNHLRESLNRMSWRRRLLLVLTGFKDFFQVFEDMQTEEAQRESL